MTTLSCYMIVRDAESTLLTAVQSVQPHVDELIIVDTGSTDGTCDIAADYATCLLKFPWCDDFSKARNFALAGCSGNWTMYLDADDVLVGGNTLRPLVETAPDGIGMYLLPYIIERDQAGAPLQEYWRERICRRDLCRWMGRVHEVLMPMAPTGHARHAGAHVDHRRSGGWMESLQRNIRLLELALEESPDDTRTMFYLGRDLIQVGSVERGMELLDRYIALGTWPDEQHIAAHLVADCHRRAGRYSEALGTDAAGVLLHPEWPHTWFALAKDAYFLERWAMSVLFCEMGQACSPPVTNLFVSPTALAFEWMIYQVRALSMVGRIEDALALTWRALAIRPDDPQHRYNARYLTDELLKRAGVPSESAAES